MSNCEHEFEHLGTEYTRTNRSYGNDIYTRIDRFYCRKCLEIKEIIKEECDCYIPEWFDNMNCRIVGR